MKDSKIAWTTHTFNPWWGCVKVSPACTNCYAETFAKRTGNDVWGKDAPRRFFGDKHWAEPLKWNEAAKGASERPRVFCASMADVFEDRDDLLVPRRRLLSLIERTPNLDWLLLTKRPENIDRLIEPWCEGEGSQPPENIWWGTTVESPDYLWRVDALLDGAPGGTTFVSCEPMLAPMSFGRWLAPRIEDKRTVFRRLSWIIFGVESGGSRRHHDEYEGWVREALSECARFGVPAFHKQSSVRGAVSHDPSEWPADLRVREYPLAVTHADATKGAK